MINLDIATHVLPERYLNLIGKGSCLYNN